MNVLNIALALGLFGIMAQAEIIELDTSIGNGADTYISNRTGHEDANWGATDSLLLRNDGNNSWGWHRQSYVRFDLSGIQGNITNASFDLGLTYNTLVGSEASIANIWDIQIYGMLDSASGNAWDENTITWNNAPGNNTGSNGFTSDFQLLGTVSIQSLPVGGRVTFSDPALLNFLNNDTDNLVTLGLRRLNSTRTDSSFILASKENTEYAAPSLALTTDAIPEPSSVLLMGLAGGAGLFIRRRMRR